MHWGKYILLRSYTTMYVRRQVHLFFNVKHAFRLNDKVSHPLPLVINDKIRLWQWGNPSLAIFVAVGRFISNLFRLTTCVLLRLLFFCGFVCVFRLPNSIWLSKINERCQSVLFTFSFVYFYFVFVFVSSSLHTIRLRYGYYCCLRWR